ncbi:MAG TPA: hypothetical protein VMR17_24380 [Xanthobacteraceae bacterium]|jgi:hypothetical protein|nr:hypothetical protein [Xanthobacteraceae bacterium]
MSPRGINGARRAIAAAVLLGALVAGCSDVYYDRRETVALGADDAVAANQIEQMVDPWPPHSNNKDLTFNGERMQRDVECYRKDRVTQPADLDPSDDTGAPPPPPGAVCQGQMTVGSAPVATGAPGNPEAGK